MKRGNITLNYNQNYMQEHTQLKALSLHIQAEDEVLSKTFMEATYSKHTRPK